MALIKARLEQFEEAYNFVNKCKEIEEQISSIYSSRYKTITVLEENIKAYEEKSKILHSTNTGKARGLIFSKISPNTPLKKAAYATLFVALIGGFVYWYRRNKS